MRITPCTTLLTLLLALAACTPAATPADAQTTTGAPPVVNASAAAATATPAATCEDADFPAFLARFAGNADVQRASTADPLTMESVDADAQPEPAPVTRQVPLGEVEFPVMAGNVQREAEGLVETVKELGTDGREVTHAIHDTGAQMRFEFRAGPCWNLVRVSDDSI
jgi:hypothetical protein